MRRELSMNARAQSLLRIDCAAGLTMGVLVLLLREPLARFYGFAEGALVFAGATNLLYACYSGALAIAAWKAGTVSRGSVTALAFGNMAWLFGCIGIVASQWGTGRAIGHAFVLVEGVVVATLGLVEYRYVRPQAS